MLESNPIHILLYLAVAGSRSPAPHAALELMCDAAHRSTVHIVLPRLSLACLQAYRTHGSSVRHTQAVVPGHKASHMHMQAQPCSPRFFAAQAWLPWDALRGSSCAYSCWLQIQILLEVQQYSQRGGEGGGGFLQANLTGLTGRKGQAQDEALLPCVQQQRMRLIVRLCWQIAAWRL